MKLHGLRSVLIISVSSACRRTCITSMRGSLTHLPRIKSIKSFIKMMNNWDEDGAPCRMPQVVVNTVEHFPFSVT